MKHFVRILTLLGFFAIAGTSHADTLTFQDTHSALSPSGTFGIFTFPQFNPALGTLNEIDLTVSYDATVSFTAAALPNTPFSMNFLFGVEVYGPDVLTSVATIKPVPAPGDYTYLMQGSGMPRFGPSPENKAYLGTGTVSLNFGVGTGSPLAQATYVVTGGTASTTLGINYLYTPNAPSVPEPGSLALAVVMLPVGLGILRSRRR